MDNVYAKLSRIRRRVKGRVQVSLRAPGLCAKGDVFGVGLRELLMPACTIDHAARLRALDEVPPLFSDPIDAHTKSVVQKTVGRDVASFVLAHDDFAPRYALMLWAFGGAPGANTILDAGSGTLLIEDGDNTYGVRENVMVGGIYAGTPLVLPLNELFVESQTTRTTRPEITEIEYALRSTGEIEARDAFMALFVRSEWDQRMMFRSCMLSHQLNVKLPSFNDIATEITERPDPYMFLHRLLVNKVVTGSDFRMLFGTPTKESVYGDRARAKLINTLYLLPVMANHERKERK